MYKKEFIIHALPNIRKALRQPISIQDAEWVIEAVLYSMGTAVKKEGELRFGNWIHLELQELPPRLYNNPQTGQMVPGKQTQRLRVRGFADLRAACGLRAPRIQVDTYDQHRQKHAKGAGRPKIYVNSLSGSEDGDDVL